MKRDRPLIEVQDKIRKLQESGAWDQRLREEASGRYISASYPGPYKAEQAAAVIAAPNGRKLTLE